LAVRRVVVARVKRGAGGGLHGDNWAAQKGFDRRSSVGHIVQLARFRGSFGRPRVGERDFGGGGHLKKVPPREAAAREVTF